MGCTGAFAGTGPIREAKSGKVYVEVTTDVARSIDFAAPGAKAKGYMAKYQQDPRFKVTTPLADNSLFLIGLKGQEAASEPFEFKLQLAAEPTTKIPFEKILGQKIAAHCAFYAGKPRHFCGIAARISQDARDDMLVYYTIDVVPQFWLLKKRVQCRIFQSESVPDILRKVLAGLDVQFVLKGKYPKHNYCVQYRESDFDFASRLMEEEGIHYYFLHTSSGHQMVVADTSSQGPPIPTESTIPFDDSTGGQRDGTHIRFWRTWQEVAPAKHTLWDHSFQLTGQDLAADSAIQKSVEIGSVELSLQLQTTANLAVFDYPGGYAQRFDAVGYNGQEQSSNLQEVHKDNQRTVKLRMAQQAAASVRIEGVSNSPYLTSGHTFKLQKHPNADGYYFITRVNHSFDLPGYRGGTTDDKPYTNEFDCLPTGLAFLPPLATPTPEISGMQTATVVGPSGEEIFTDKHGRVQVQFNWQAPGSNSCWVRVGQAWAGSQWGGIFIPRVGQEVIISFLEGDPDAPIITGNVYNSQQNPPFELPANRTRMAIKSQSTPGGSSDTFSGIAFEDQKGSEHVQIHSEKDMTHQTENNHYINTGNSYYHRTQSSRLRQTGGFPGIGGGGGGSGGGGDESEPESDDYYHGPFDWKNGDVEASMGVEVALTLGIEAESVTGLDLQANIGATMEVFVNPLNLLGEVPGIGGLLAGPVGALGAVLTGAYTEIMFGAGVELIYGPKIDVHHGTHCDVTGWNAETKVPTIIWATLVAAAVTGTILEAACLEDKPETLTDVLVLTDIVGAIAIVGLTYMEHLNYDVTATVAADKLAAQTTKIAKAAEDAAKLAIAPQVKKATDEAAAAALSAANASRDAAAALGSATGASGSAANALASEQSAARSAAVPNRIQLINGSHSLTTTGGDTTVASILDPVALPPAGGNVFIMANSTLTDTNGLVSIGGSNSVLINGGAACIGVSDLVPGEGQAVVSAGGMLPASSVILRRGQLGRNITINQLGITIDAEAEEEDPGLITIKTMEGALSITMDPVAGMMTFTAPNISFKAETSIQFETGTMGVTFLEEFNVAGPSINMEGTSDLTLTVEESVIGLTAAGISMEGLTQEAEIETSITINVLAQTFLVDGEAAYTITMAMME